MASIFTSLYPFQHGVVTGFLATKQIRNNVNPTIKLNRIPDEITTIAEVFKNAGYKTYAVADNLNICEEEGFTQGFDKFQNYTPLNGDLYEGADVVNNKLGEWEKTIKSQHPYFLYIHYMDPHYPYHGRSPWYEKSDIRPLDLISAYDSEISYVDAKIKEMFGLFGWHSNTLLVVTSDHGEEFLDHGGVGHGKTLYSEVVRVPLLMYFPEGGLENRRIENNVSLIDILPTLREFIGLAREENDEGVSLVPFLRRKGFNFTGIILFLREKVMGFKKRCLFSHLWRKKGEASGKNSLYKEDTIRKAVIQGDWKHILTLPDFEEVFNLRRDSKERLNIITVVPTITQELRSKLTHFEDNCKKYSQEEVEVPVTEEGLDKLKSLGYL